MNISLSMGVFMSLMFLIGLGLVIVSFKIAEEATGKNCITKSVQRSIRGLLIMSVMLLSVSLTYMICGCGMAVSHNTIGMFFTAFMLTICITILVLSSIIHSNCTEARKDTTALLWLSSIVTACAGAYLGLEVYNMTTGSTVVKSEF